MNLEGIMLSEISHTEKDALFSLYDLSYMWNLKAKLIKTGSRGWRPGTVGEGKRGGVGQMAGISSRE